MIVNFVRNDELKDSYQKNTYNNYVDVFLKQASLARSRHSLEDGLGLATSQLEPIIAHFFLKFQKSYNFLGFNSKNIIRNLDFGVWAEVWVIELKFCLIWSVHGNLRN